MVMAELQTIPEEQATTPGSTGPTGGTDRRQQLLSIAAEVFAKNGVVHTTVRQIADQAGILSGSLYHHFQSKDKMVAEILERGLWESGVRDDAIIAAAKNPRQAMEQLIYSLVFWVHDEPHVAQILTNDRQYITSAPELVQVAKERRARGQAWIRVVNQGMADGLFNESLDADLVVRLTTQGILDCSRWLPPTGHISPEDMGRQLATFYISGMLK